jgi:putative two-component system response regulator
MAQHTQFLTNLSILAVDDDERELENFRDFIIAHGGLVHIALGLHDAFNLVETHQFDVCLCDIICSGDGSSFEFTDLLKTSDPELTVILMCDTPSECVINKVLKKNIYTLLTKPCDVLSLGLLLLQASRNTRNARRNSHVANNLRAKLERIQAEKDHIFFQTLQSLSNALEQKDEYTKNHSEFVGQISEKICLEYSANSEFLEDVTIAGRLHDIGKIGIRDDILFAKRSLTDDEYELIKKHPEMSYEIVKPVDNDGKISSYILHHHERWNGEGYPHKLKEKGIPVGARILAVADTYNALTSNRPYREAKDIDFALDILHDGSSILFDPEIVEVMHKLVRTGRV